MGGLGVLPIKELLKILRLMVLKVGKGFKVIKALFFDRL